MRGTVTYPTKQKHETEARKRGTVLRPTLLPHSKRCCYSKQHRFSLVYFIMLQFIVLQLITLDILFGCPFSG